MANSVIIIGGGLSGLVAARQLCQHGINVQILEAQADIGGRIVDFHSQCGPSFSLGGDWFGAGESRLNQLLSDLALDAVPLGGDSQHQDICRLGDQSWQFAEADSHRLSPIAVPQALVGDELLNAFAEIETLAAQVSTTEPHLSPAEWDTITLDIWRDQHITDATQRTLFDIVVREETGRELRDTSLLYYLYIYQSSVRILEDDHVVSGGTRRLIDALAAPLSTNIHNQSPVQSLQYEANGVTAITTDGRRFIADHAIVAMAPAIVNKIDFQPALPTDKHALCANMEMGRIIKCVITYPTAFWYEQGLSGNTLSDHGPLECTLDASFQTQCGALIGYFIGDTAETWSQCSQAERQQAVLTQLATFFGDQALNPLEYSDINWPATSWAQGAYYGSLAPGALSAYGKTLREPTGPIHWAGTETSADWCGTLEGAVRSGERAAAEILARH